MRQSKEEINKALKAAKKQQIEEQMSHKWTSQIIEYFRNPWHFWQKYNGDDMVTPSFTAKPLPKQPEWKDISFFSKSD